MTKPRANALTLACVAWALASTLAFTTLFAPERDAKLQHRIEQR